MITLNKVKLKDGSFLSNFNSVRKVIALLVTVVFCYLSITGDVKTSEFIPVFSMIVGYYFGKSTALDVPTDIQVKDETNITNNNAPEDN